MHKKCIKINSRVLKKKKRKTKKKKKKNPTEKAPEKYQSLPKSEKEQNNSQHNGCE